MGTCITTTTLPREIAPRKKYPPTFLPFLFKTKNKKLGCRIQLLLEVSSGVAADKENK